MKEIVIKSIKSWSVYKNNINSWVEELMKWMIDLLTLNGLTSNLE